MGSSGTSIQISNPQAQQYPMQNVWRGQSMPQSGNYGSFHYPGNPSWFQSPQQRSQRTDSQLFLTMVIHLGQTIQQTRIPSFKIYKSYIF